MASTTLIEGLNDNNETGLLQVIIPAASLQWPEGATAPTFHPTPPPVTTR